MAGLVGASRWFTGSGEVMCQGPAVSKITLRNKVRGPGPHSSGNKLSQQLTAAASDVPAVLHAFDRRPAALRTLFKSCYSYALTQQFFSMSPSILRWPTFFLCVFAWVFASSCFPWAYSHMCCL